MAVRGGDVERVARSGSSWAGLANRYSKHAALHRGTVPTRRPAQIVAVPHRGTRDSSLGCLEAMETQLYYGLKDKQLSFRLRESVTADPDVEVRFKGLLNTVTGQFQ